MRVTNNMLTSNFLRNVNQNLNNLDKYQMQLARNKRITKLSDDPIGVIKSMSVNSKLSKIDQYKSNLNTAQAWLKQTETALKSMNNLITTAYEQSIEAANAYITDDEKLAIAENIKQLRNEVLTLGNTKNGDKYIFGGYNTEKAPFSLDAAGNILYNGLDLSDPTLFGTESGQNLQIEIGYGLRTNASINGTELMGMGPNNIYAVLDGMYDTLMSGGSTADIAAYTPKLQNAQYDVLALEAEVGGRSNRLDLVESRNEDDILNYTEVKSNIEDIDEAEVIMQLKMAESVYNAAMSVGADIIQPTLMDFLNR
jgi:flagellar hook-associated protein 3 FlgL